MGSNGGPGRGVLRRTEAALRAERVHDVSYALWLELAEGRDTYQGRAEVSFGLRAAAGPLFLEFAGGVSSLEVNGKRVTPHQRDQRLWLDAADLGSRNQVVVEYENRFDATGDGLHRFVDPQDGATYVYSNLEPYSAHRLFPCFDQPDIKATYELTVTAPAGWQVVSAELPERSDGAAGAPTIHRFPRSARFSTYLFSVIAGPFARLDAAHAGIPLGLLGRATMRAELERSGSELFELTRQGLDHYADLFGRRFPFGKYDQLFVPEFNAGAMENVGAVTFNDAYLFRDPPTYAQRLLRGEVVLHELAHMWFGDLVTMRWWDDLWLNETFATYLSYRCLVDATRFADAWQVFNGQMRPAAYRQDQLTSTHPVATRVDHTDQAVGNFDAITYEKGAAVIKQLVATLGDDAFRRGMHRYVERHAWDNATLDDLLGALGEAAGRELDGWARVWLQTPSLNTVSAHWRARDGRIEGLELRQAAPAAHATLRPHSTIVGLVTDDASSGRLRLDAIPVHLEGARAEVPEAAGRPAPLFVFPNLGDHDYALAELDPVSLAFALERLPELPDSLLRQQVWSTLWEMVCSAQLRSSDYLAAVRRFAPRETGRAMVQSILDRAMVVQRRFVPEEQQAASAAALTATALAAFRASHDADLRLVWTRAAASAAAGADELAELLDLVDDTSQVPRFEADQQLRWTVAIKAVAYDLADAAERLASEHDRDRSDRGERAFIRGQVSAPDGEVKRRAWERIHAEGYGSDYRTRAAIGGFQWAHQREILLPYRDPFYAEVADVYARRDPAFAESYLRSLVPDRWAEPMELRRIRAFAEGLSPQQGLLRRHLSEVADDVERDIRVRAFSSLAEGPAGLAEVPAGLAEGLAGEAEGPAGERR